MNGSVRVDVSPGRVEVAPGSSFTVAVRVVNGTKIVDEFTIEVVGAAAGWAAVDRPRVSLLPDQEQTVLVTLSPPRQQPPPAGSRTAGVKVASVTQPHATWVEELPVDVAPVAAAALDVRPQQVRGGRSARFTAGIVNEGNVPLQLTLRGEDPEHAVTFRFDPSRVDLAPGARAEAQVQVSAGRAWAGPDVTRPLTVRADGGHQPLSATASFVQRSRLAGGLVKAVGTLATVALVGVAVFVASRLASDGPPDDLDLAGVVDDEDDDQAPEEGEEPDEQGPFVVPSVVGMTRVQAMALLRTGCPEGANCLDVFVVQQFDDDVEEGIVLAVDPSEGTEVEVGDEVILTVSTGDKPFDGDPGKTLTGTWVNVDPETDGLTRLEIDHADDQAIVHVFERCLVEEEEVCDRGVEVGSVEVVPAIALGQPGTDRATIEWDHGTHERTMTLSRRRGTPEAAVRVELEIRRANGVTTSEQYTFQRWQEGLPFGETESSG